MLFISCQEVLKKLHPYPNNVNLKNLVGFDLPFQAKRYVLKPFGLPIT